MLGWGVGSPGGRGDRRGRRERGLWPTKGDDDDERLDVLLSYSLLVRRYNSFFLISAILIYEMLGFFLL